MFQSGRIVYAYPFFVGNRKSDDTDNNQQPSNGNGNGANGNGNGVTDRQVMVKQEMVNSLVVKVFSQM